MYNENKIYPSTNSEYIVKISKNMYMKLSFLSGVFHKKDREGRVRGPSELVFFGQMEHPRQLDSISSARWCPSKRDAGSAKGQVDTCLSLTVLRAPQAVHAWI